MTNEEKRIEAAAEAMRRFTDGVEKTGAAFVALGHSIKAFGEAAQALVDAAMEEERESRDLRRQPCGCGMRGCQGDH